MRLIARAERGEAIVIARGRKPVAKLVHIADAPRCRRFGAMRGRARVTRAFSWPCHLKMWMLGSGRVRRLLDTHAPFDRMLIAPAQMENLPIVTNETLFDAFGVEGTW